MKKETKKTTKKIPYLTSTEYEFMKVLWAAEKPLSIAEILESSVDGTWSKNSAHPLINSLLDKGFITVSGIVKATKANSRLYVANISIYEYTSSQVSKVLDNDDKKINISSLMSNFIGTNEKHNNQLIEDLEDWLANYKEKYIK